MLVCEGQQLRRPAAGLLQQHRVHSSCQLVAQHCPRDQGEGLHAALLDAPALSRNASGAGVVRTEFLNSAGTRQGAHTYLQFSPPLRLPRQQLLPPPATPLLQRPLTSQCSPRSSDASDAAGAQLLTPARGAMEREFPSLGLDDNLDNLVTMLGYEEPLPHGEEEGSFQLSASPRRAPGLHGQAGPQLSRALYPLSAPCAHQATTASTLRRPRRSDWSLCRPGPAEGRAERQW